MQFIFANEMKKSVFNVDESSTGFMCFLFCLNSILFCFVESAQAQYCGGLGRGDTSIELKVVGLNGVLPTSAPSTEIPSVPQMTVFPNITNGIINIHFNRNFEVAYTVRVIDLLGTVLINEKFNAEKGTNKCVVNLNSLAYGFYLLVLETENGNLFSQRIIVE